MIKIFVKLQVDAPQHNRTSPNSEESINSSAGKEVAFGIYQKNDKNEDALIAYIPQQQIVLAFVEIIKFSSVFEMLSSGLHKGNSFDHLITTALKEMTTAVDFKK